MFYRKIYLHKISKFEYFLASFSNTASSLPLHSQEKKNNNFEKNQKAEITAIWLNEELFH